MKAAFTGTGGQLFVTALVSNMPTMITLYIYMPWFMTNMIRWAADNFELRGDDGVVYKLRYEGTGGELFVTLLVGALLSIITLYIYMPWFMCNLRKTIYNRTTILRDGQAVGKLDFNGTGGELFVTMLIGGLLSAITLYIYMPWFMVNIQKFWVNNTEIHVDGAVVRPSFEGTGGELFVTYLVGVLLTVITLYIYMPWFVVKLYKFNFENVRFQSSGGGGKPGWGV